LDFPLNKLPFQAQSKAKRKIEDKNQFSWETKTKTKKQKNKKQKNKKQKTKKL